MTTFSTRVTEWKNRGHTEKFRDYNIHCFYQKGTGPLLVLFHGYPSCSYDWRELIDLQKSRSILTFDFLGFGLSDKPRNHEYTLTWQADLAEELISRHDGEEPIIIAAHDMGTSVASELFARDMEGKLKMNILAAVLFNGNMIMSNASLILGQKILRSPVGFLLAKIHSQWMFRWQFGTVFSRAHPLTREEGDDQWALLVHNGGHHIIDKLIQYTFERERLAVRWHGALRDWDKPLAFAWGMLDPVATALYQLKGLRELRPQAPVIEIPGVAHYPQLEDCKSFKEALETAFAKLEVSEHGN